MPSRSYFWRQKTTLGCAVLSVLTLIALSSELRSLTHLAPWLVSLVMSPQQQQQQAVQSLAETGLLTENVALNRSEVSSGSYYTCDFRNYNDASRMYGLMSDSYPPAFLRSSFYIHGEPPVLLPIDNSVLAFSEGKVCFQPSEDHLKIEVESKTTHQRTFLTLDQPKTDGTNPTLISLERIKSEITDSTFFPTSQVLQTYPTAAYLVSNTFKSASQCEYDRSKTKSKNKMDDYKEVHPYPPGRQNRNEVSLMLVDSHMRTLAQTTILDPTGNSTLAADDARLLVHNGAIWLTFKRYGDNGGNGMALYVAQLNFRLLASQSATPSLNHRIEARAPKEWQLCCGRNFMAFSKNENLLSQSSTMQFLTWPDPVWVQSFDPERTKASGINKNGKDEVIGFQNPNITSKTAKGKGSNYHGTSGFMLFLPETSEYLGVGHIHRERKWAKDFRADAKFGHHYTHSFFTIASQPPYQLTRLSQEFLLPSKTRNFEKDADVIQFASGLEWVTGSNRQRLALGYGINDCEGAIVEISWKTVNSMLRPVRRGSQIAHSMSNMTRDEFMSKARSSSNG